MKEILENNFYTMIDYNYCNDEFYVDEDENEIIIKDFIVSCTQVEQEASFYYNSTNNTIDKIIIHFHQVKEILITYNFYLKICQVKIDSETYEFEVLADGQLFTTNKNVRQNFDDFDQLAFYFTNKTNK